VRERAALALTDAVTHVAEGHVPRDVFEAVAEQFEPKEIAHLIWQITAINTWNRIAISTLQRAGESRAGSVHALGGSQAFARVA